MNLNLENLFEVKKQLYLEKMPFSKKKYNVLKEHKKSSSIFPPSGTYSKKPNPSKTVHTDHQKVQHRIQAGLQAIH